MRSFILAVILASGACAHSTNPGVVNVAAVRAEINGTIRSEHGDRSIHSMGKTRNDAAVVYTTATDGTKSEETWVRVDGKWTLRTRTALK